MQLTSLVSARCVLSFAIIVFGLAAISAPASGSAAAPDVRTVPAKLVGKWTRKITSSDVFRVQATSFLAGNVCTLRIWKRGPGRLDCTNLGLTGRILLDGPNLVHILDAGPGVKDVFKTTNLYRWRVSGRRLTLTTIVDRTPDRAAALWGVWKRTSAQAGTPRRAAASAEPRMEASESPGSTHPDRAGVTAGVRAVWAVHASVTR